VGSNPARPVLAVTWGAGFDLGWAQPVAGLLGAATCSLQLSFSLVEALRLNVFIFAILKALLLSGFTE